jgi:hypothetical protein
MSRLMGGGISAAGTAMHSSSSSGSGTPAASRLPADTIITIMTLQQQQQQQGQRMAHHTSTQLLRWPCGPRNHHHIRTRISKARCTLLTESVYSHRRIISRVGCSGQLVQAQ